MDFLRLSQGVYQEGSGEKTTDAKTSRSANTTAEVPPPTDGLPGICRKLDHDLGELCRVCKTYCQMIQMIQIDLA